MPLPVDVQPGTAVSLRRRVERWLHRRPRPGGELLEESPPAVADAAAAAAPRVDSATHAFWGRSAQGDRVSALIREHERGPQPGAGGARGNPAFGEALFVELMRAHQYRRAFELLSSDCRAAWGSADAFAAAQGGALRRLRGVRVRDVRFLPEWTDTRAGRTYQGVAELQAEYTLGERESLTVVPRTVHLVPDGGRWRSLCYPG